MLVEKYCVPHLQYFDEFVKSVLFWAILRMSWIIMTVTITIYLTPNTNTIKTGFFVMGIHYTKCVKMLFEVKFSFLNFYKI